MKVTIELETKTLGEKLHLVYIAGTCENIAILNTIVENGKQYRNVDINPFCPRLNANQAIELQEVAKSWKLDGITI
jgi:hypothetical protein